MPEKILRKHIEICDTMHDLLIEENNELKIRKADPSQGLLQKKKELLPLLDESVKQIKRVKDEAAVKDRGNQELIKSAQKKLMKIFYLIRENEQLLLKNATRPAAVLKKPTSMSELQSVYGK